MVTIAVVSLRQGAARRVHGRRKGRAQDQCRADKEFLRRHDFNLSVSDYDRKPSATFRSLIPMMNEAGTTAALSRSQSVSPFGGHAAKTKKS